MHENLEILNYLINDISDYTNIQRFGKIDLDLKEFTSTLLEKDIAELF